MPPAFDSTKQAAAFLLLLVFLLVSPWLAHKTFLPAREKTYSSQSIRDEVTPWVQKFIFEETNDIDIAFVGSSRLGHGIDTPYVQEQFEERVGRKGLVRSLYLRAKGFDEVYFYTKDLLEHRHVKALVFCDECYSTEPLEVHMYAPRWYRYGEGDAVMAGLPIADRSIYYFAAVIGMPRNYLEVLSQNLARDTNATLTSFIFKEGGLGPDPETTLGCIFTPYDWYDMEKKWTLHDFDIPLYVPKTGLTPADVRIYSPTNAADFVFSTAPVPGFALYFARQFGDVAKKHGCQLMLLHMPVLTERHSSVITESRYWPDLLQTDVRMVGIPGARLFNGLSEQEIGQLYIDPIHMNENGQKYFTSLITPATIQFYEDHFNH